MTNAFSRLVLPILRRVIDLVHSLESDSSPSLEDVKRKIRSWIDDADLRAAGDPTLAIEYPMAKFAIVSLIDELLTNSEWGRSEHIDWGSEQHVLEFDLYQDHNRAWKFFKHAETAFSGVTQGRISADPLETYLLAVALGFRGEPPGEGDLPEETKLNAWVDRVYNKVCESSALSDRAFPDDDAKGGPLAPRGGPALLLKVSVLTSITAIVTLAAYLLAMHVWYQAMTS